MTEEDPLLTVSDLMKRWRMSRATVHRRIADGTLKAITTNPRGRRKNYRIPLSVIEAVENEQ